MAPLHAAVEHECTDAVVSLLEAGADAAAADRAGVTPLHIAAANCHLDAVQLLLAAGAAVSATDSGGRTPLHDAAACDEWSISSRV